MKLVQTYAVLPDLKRLIGFKLEYLGTWFTVFKFEIEPSYNRYAPDNIIPIPRRTTWSDFSETA
ncbi:hypothetical protein HYP07_gp015 [Vibrio phage JSF3]|uniref:Uncharacterized protein n=2 Tax=Pacinivirus VCO139 TaxID=2846607 RepID=R9R4T5_9CAUD|nr:hypothetical protein M612_gp29 [Vibrio phage JA-1]YP_009874376.1 hypothetical protein HYO77_gp29 [Vibrio phage VCO139]YP_009876240.1 hypothetical protein HYP07_gp015 [Vibrio phage JSF3]AGI61826.1 hypothetical protein JA1_0074 [Vibrio phage JA-1]AGI61901.1 hypothetical protein VCO139_0075 [Vibrio phage VCO139]APD18027.1 hypothetical protein [Vibrio phage JSF3]